MTDSIDKIGLKHVNLYSKRSSLSNSKAVKEFKDYLAEAQDELKFSKHALQRLKTREINLDESKLHKLNEAVAKAKSKGARDALILVEDMAFIVNIPSKTVVTALNETESKEHIFTQIDSTIIMKEPDR